MVRITKMYANHQRMGEELRTHVLAGGTLVLSWTAECDDADNAQTACRAQLSCEGQTIYDSGRAEQSEQAISVDASAFPAGKKIEWTLSIWDRHGAQSAPASETIYIAPAQWTADWIAAPMETDKQAVYFRREFRVDRPLRAANLYVCGLGYQSVTINGMAATDAFLDPPHTDYTKECQYVSFPEVQTLLRIGVNCIGVIAGCGWRDNEYFYEQKNDHVARFMGMVQLSAMLTLEYEDGETEVLRTDEAWQAGTGMIAANSLFDGECWNANCALPDWDKAGFEGFESAKVVSAPGGRMVPMYIPPMYAQETLKVKRVLALRPGVWLYDFGRNIAGVPRIRLPKLEKGQQLTIEVTEHLRPDRTPDRHTIRRAAARDEYVFSGDERDAEIWQPKLTYHGFRYFTLEGAWLEPERVEAVMFCTDLDSDSFFTCGSALVNQIQQMVLNTERDNQHSILTDCPQRDERMGWMNDATVRFEETVSNFYAYPMMRKVVSDIMDAQAEDGGITCTAPFVWGNCPGDPVCSSFLIAGWLAYRHYGDVSVMEQGFDAFAAWEQCLLDHSDDYIVNYGYYGDWAGPMYACNRNSIGDGAQSAVTPEILMSTGYSYYNCRMLAQMANVLGRAADEEKFAALAERIREAMLQKWYDVETHVYGTDSMASLTFALWLEILPEADRQAVADRLNDKLVEAEYRFTTGNLCTRYLFEVLTKYGHVDTAWTLINREEYPSWGWMIQNEATTVWERFELMDESGMNSHNHPMYAAVGYWFYADIVGVRPLEPGFRKARIEPHFPEKLQHASAQMDTVQGKLNVHWIRKEGSLHLNVQVPFGMTAEVRFAGKTETVGSGLHHWEV